MVSPQELMEKLLDAGAAIQVLFTDSPMITQVLATVRWIDDPKSILWCPVFAEHQGHVHWLRYDRVETLYERDVVFYKGRRLVGTVVPIEESTLDIGQARDSFAAWQAAIAQGNNKENFERFLFDAS